MAALPKNQSEADLHTRPRFRIVPPASTTQEPSRSQAFLRDWLRFRLGQDAVPRRTLTSSEQDAVALLHTAFHDRRWTGTWSDLSFAVEPRFAQQLLDDFAEDTVRGLGLRGPALLLDVFGRSVDLGPERLVFLQARLENQRAIRIHLSGARNAGMPVELRFTPADNAMVDGWYEREPRVIGTQPPDPGDSHELAQRIQLGDYLRARPGRWSIAVSPPLAAPIELPAPPDGQARGWRLDVPDRVAHGLEQLDPPERNVALQVLWQVQRDGEQGLGDQVKHVQEGTTLLYVLRPTPEIGIVLRQAEPDRVALVEVVRTQTLKMFREW
jgi:hypothetical protein